MRIRPLLLKAGAVLALMLLPVVAHLQSGVLMPSSTSQPDASVLSLDEMAVDVLIDNQFSRVRVTQIFGNRAKTPQEGSYVFLIPTSASISL